MLNEARELGSSRILFGNAPIFDASGARAKRTIEDRPKARRVLKSAKRIAVA